MEPTNADKKSMARKWGEQAEELAADHMRKHGYMVRERHWRPGRSHLEVDIIAQKDDTMIFVEVKARTSEDSGDPADAIDMAKMRKLVRAANIYLQQQPYDYFYRFDVITVVGNEQDYRIDHLPDAFLPPLSNF